MREPDDRLARLESYQALPLPLRRAVRLHLVHGVPALEAMRLSGRERNAKRDWNQSAVQTVVREYTDQPEDWEARLAALKEEPPEPLCPPPTKKPLEIAPESLQDAPGPTAEQPKQPEYPPNCPNTAQDTIDPKVETDVPVDRLFEGIRWPLNDAGLTSLDIWRRQAADEEAERQRLIAAIEYQNRLNHF